MTRTLEVGAPPSAGQGWLRILLLSLAIVLLVVVVGTIWLIARRPPTANPIIEQDLTALVRPEQIPQRLVLLALADYPPNQVWQEAINAGDLEGAYGLWLYGPPASDSVDLEAMFTLAERFRTVEPDRSASLLLAASDVARLSPELSDRARAQYLIAAGHGLVALGLPAAAVTEWRQASLLAHFSPELPPLVRATLLQELFLAYEEVGASRLAAAAQSQVSQVGSATGVLPVPSPAPLETATRPDFPPELEALQSRRRQLAIEAALALEAGQDPALLLAALADVAEQEGLARRQWVAEMIQSAPSRAVQAALLLDHVGWLQRERLLASGAAGEQFAGWIGRRPTIERAQHESWDALEVVRLDQSLGLGQQQEATLAQRDWWASRLVQGRMARDPLLDHEEIRRSMIPNNADEAGRERLRLDWQDGRYWRLPRENVGTNRLPE